MNEEKSVRTYDEDQIVDLLRRTQELEKQKNMLLSVYVVARSMATR